jgi:hypothetical protein
MRQVGNRKQESIHKTATIRGCCKGKVDGDLKGLKWRAAGLLMKLQHLATGDVDIHHHHKNAVARIREHT